MNARSQTPFGNAVFNETLFRLFQEQILMQYRRIGNCGAKVSMVGFGSWLTIGGTVDTSVSFPKICIKNLKKLFK